MFLVQSLRGLSSPVIFEEHEKLGYSPNSNMRCKLGSFFLSWDVFNIPRLSSFVDPTSSVVWLYGCADMVVC